MAQPANTLTTPEQRALWQKAVSSPDQLTADERQEVLNEPPIATKTANILKVSGLMPEEFMAKATQNLEALTKQEIDLIWHKFHIATPAKILDITDDRYTRSNEDWDLWGKASVAVGGPKREALYRAVSELRSRRYQTFLSYPGNDIRQADFKSPTMAQPTNTLTTPEQRALWQKAISSPDQLTADERQEVWNEPPLATKTTNILKVSGLTPEEFMAKATQNLEALTKQEIDLIFYDFHIATPAERLDAGDEHRARSKQDWALWNKAFVAVGGPQKEDLSRAVSQLQSRRLNTFLSHPGNDIRQADFKSPPAWFKKVDKLESWGFVAFRGASIGRSSQEWDQYLSYAKSSVPFVLIPESKTITATKRYDFVEGDVDDTDYVALRQMFYAKQSQLKPGFLTNTFLVFDKESTDPYFAMCDQYGRVGMALYRTEELWVWAYDANFTPNSATTLPSDGSEDKYCGRIRVSLSSLFSWFYAVRALEKYSMEELWHKAQMQPAKCWYVKSIGGAYHTRLVLPKPGEMRGTYTAEL